MEELLKLAVDAHGGMEAWDRFKLLEAKLHIGGAIWQYKQKPGLLNDVTYRLPTHEERLSIDGFSGADKRLRFTPELLVFEHQDGMELERRAVPRSAFAGQSESTPWDKFHVGYFASYALWTYLTSPFLYTYPGFKTAELPVWHENGEEWRRLKVYFPDNVPSHTREQTTYFGPDGLMRRHDYRVEILGGATGANYPSEYREFQGIKMPTRRRIYAYDGENQKVPEPLLVSIDIDHVSFEPA